MLILRELAAISEQVFLFPFLSLFEKKNILFLFLLPKSKRMSFKMKVSENKYVCVMSGAYSTEILCRLSVVFSSLLKKEEIFFDIK